MLRDRHAVPRRESQGNRKKKEREASRRPHRRERRLARKVPHDDCVHRVVELLQERACHHRKREAERVFPRRARCH